MLRFCGFQHGCRCHEVELESGLGSASFEVREDRVQKSGHCVGMEDMPVATPPPLHVEPSSCTGPRTDPRTDLDVVARRNNSLGARQLWTVFGVLAAFSLALACAFVAAGAWMVLPYSVLELALVGLAFRLVERRAGDWERLVVTGDRVIVERRYAGGRERREFNLCWLHVECEDLARGRDAQGAFRRFGADPALTLAFAGEAWRFGDALSAAERVAIARDLRRLIAARQ